MKKQRQKKYKGVRYIAKVLQKYGGKKYKGNYKQALTKSREVLKQLQDQGQKVKVKSILQVTRKHRVTITQKQKPLLYYKLSKAEPYFDLINYPNYINSTTNEITFRSSIFNIGVEEVEGGTKPAYKDTFSSFVNFGNKEMSAGKISSSDEVQIFIKCTEPEQDKDGNWFSEIISVDLNGDPYEFGFEPKEPVDYFKPIEYEPSKEKVKSKKQVKSEQEKIKELDLKIKKEENRSLAMKLFLDGKITKKEYKDMIADINKNE